MSTEGRDTRQGLVLGFIAYAAVALFYSIFDVLAARGTLFTVNMLGLSVFRGMRDASVLTGPVPVDSQAVFLYNALHLVLSLLIGLVVMRFVAQAERRPSQAWQMYAFIAAGYVVTILAVGYLTPHIRHVLPWWSIVAANSAAVVAGAAYVLRARPGLFGQPIGTPANGIA